MEGVIKMVAKMKMTETEAKKELRKHGWKMKKGSWYHRRFKKGTYAYSLMEACSFEFISYWAD
jgi:hypothetical protein